MLIVWTFQLLCEP